MILIKPRLGTGIVCTTGNTEEREDIYFFKLREETNVFNLGIELEYGLSPNFSARRTLVQNKLNTLGAKSLCTHVLDSLNFDKDLLYYGDPHMDYPNVEIAFSPISSRAFRVMSVYLQNMMDNLKAVGFYNALQGASCTGLHISIDSSEIVDGEHLKRLYLLLWEMDEAFIRLSGREGYADSRADMKYMLSSSYDRMLSEVIKSLGQNFDQKKSTSMLGIRSEPGRVQFAQFNSTLDTEELMTRLELIESMVKYTAQTQSVTTDGYANYVEENKDAYPELVWALPKVKLNIKNDQQRIRNFAKAVAG